MVATSTDPKSRITRRFATIPQTADYLQCGIRTVRRMIDSGEITAYRLHKRAVRIDLNEIDAKLERVRTMGTFPAGAA